MRESYTKEVHTVNGTYYSENHRPKPNVRDKCCDYHIVSIPFYTARVAFHFSLSFQYGVVAAFAKRLQKVKCTRKKVKKSVNEFLHLLVLFCAIHCSPF